MGHSGAARRRAFGQVRLKPDTTYEIAGQVRLKPDTTYEIAGQVRLKPDTTYEIAGQVRLKPDTTYEKRRTWGGFRDLSAVASAKVEADPPRT
jgi:hypothetical protein